MSFTRVTREQLPKLGQSVVCWDESFGERWIGEFKHIGNGRIGFVYGKNKHGKYKVIDHIPLYWRDTD